MALSPTSSIHLLYDAVRTAVVALERDRGRISVSGQDRASFLHGLFTNDIAALTPGRGCYTAYLTPQGRMIADFLVYELGDRILLTCDRSLTAAMLARLDQLVFAEDVRLADVTDAFSSVALAGPRAAAVVAALIDGVDPAALSSLPEHGSVQGHFDGAPALVVRITDIGAPGFEILVPTACGEALDTALAGEGVPRGGDDLAETLRIEAGIPRFLRDMDTETIPLEAGIESRAISMTKGCYVGQEVIVRVLHRGHGRVAEKLVTLTLDGGDAPSAGAVVEAGGRAIGRITSSAVSPAIGRPVALAYVHRDFTAPGSEVRVGHAQAIVREPPVKPDV